jgi:uncharacterized protein (DUF305 family)
MKNQIIIAVIVSLVVGFGAGYAIFGSKIPASKEMAHQMPDGSMMYSNGMQKAMDGMMANLYGKVGDEFDKAFISEMIMHHQGAVDMAQAALKNAKHQEIKDLANAIITAQTKEIGMMQQWGAQWYK